MREKNFGFIFWVAVLFYLSTCSSNCEEEEKSRQTYVIRYKDGEQTIPVTVVLDYKKQTEHVINMNPRTPAKSVTLYDFKQRTIAYKDLTNRECFLGRLTHETLSEESNALQDVKNPVEVRPKLRSLDPRKPALTPTEIRNIAGQKTAVFCRKMNTWLLVPEKGHGISKREVDEYEERTYQYQGHRSSQYSHYERETRRRFRNRNQPNARRRSQRKESEAKNENIGLEVPEPSSFLPHRNVHPANGIHFKSDHLNKAIQNHSTSSPSHRGTYLDPTKTYVNKENSRVSFSNVIPSTALNINQNHRYPNAEGRSLSNDEIRHYPRYPLHDINSNETNKLDYELLQDVSGNTSRHFRKSDSPEKIISESTNSISERETTTKAPYVAFGQPGYPNVHSSLVHLLPLYKPLRKEFDFDQENSTQRNVNGHQVNHHRNIESEDHPMPTVLIESDTFTHLKVGHNISLNPDASTNVLEIPSLTKEFEHLKDNETYLSQTPFGKNKQLHSSTESHPLLSGEHSGNAPNFQKNNPQREQVEHVTLPANIDDKETHIKRNDFHIPQTDANVLPLLTTKEYHIDDVTTSNPLYIPSVHTAFQNSEDFNAFQIFPNYIENTDPASIQRNSGAHSIHIDRTNGNTREPQSLVSTAGYPTTKERHGVGTNHRSDIPSEDSNGQSLPSFNLDRSRHFHILPTNNTIDGSVPSYKIRYQSVLRDFKPDEIVIDIENIPTHTPAPFTAGFQQRLITTIQPTVKPFSTNGIKSDTDRRSEQISGTTLRNSYPTTRYPKRRINEKPQRPMQNSSLSPIQKTSLNYNYNRYQSPKPPTRINQFTGVSHFRSTHHTNRRPFHYPNRPIPPSRVIMPSETNQIHHMNHFNNLPPGVSVHPRHPQAPFADMVLSNRPPTIPFVNENQVFMKPHRERHHRKKERHPNSCCRLRGQSSAFQSCCKNGGTCCSRSRRRMQPSGSHCCSSSNAIGQITPSKQIQPPVRITNQTLPPIRTEKTHRSEVDNRDRCQKEKMCRTLYESTQQVIVCRNAHVEGC